AGPNGSGKSSLLKLALGHLKARTGEVAWFGRPLVNWSRRELARRVAYLPPAPTTLPGQAVLDVLASGRAPYWGAFGVGSQADRLAATEAAELLGLADWLRRDVATLSGGQRQRVFIARCVAQTLDPASRSRGGAILLLDEPDTYLDLRHIAELGRVLRDLAHQHGLGILLASHDLNFAAGVADRVALLAGGRVRATGPAAEVLTPASIQSIYETQVDVLQRDGRTFVIPER